MRVNFYISRRQIAGLILALLVGMTIGACSRSSDTVESIKVTSQQAWYSKYQPVGFYTWSLPRQLLSQLYDAKNTAVRTYSYVQSPYTGKILWQCPSIGYPIPVGTQLTNPLQVARDGNDTPLTGGPVIGQAEPEGTFSPATGSGTYVMCVGPNGKIRPRYEEKLVTTSPVMLEEKNGELVEVTGAVPSIELDPNRPANIPASAPAAPAK